MLTPMRVKKLAAKQSAKTNRRVMLKAFAPSNSVWVTRLPENPAFQYPKNQRDEVYMSDDEILDSLLHHQNRRRVKKNLTKLMPELVSDEVKGFMIDIINRTKGIKAK